MPVFRRVILPVAWLAVGVVATAALAKLAFFPDPAVEGTALGVGAEPTGQLTEPVVTVERGDVRNDLSLKATISSDPAVELTVYKAGDVVDVFFTEGGRVNAGDIVASVREEVPTEDGGTFDLWSEIIAPATGTISDLPLTAGAPVAVGDVAGMIAPDTFRVMGAIAAADRYRLTAEPSEATIAITGGPTFTCTDVKIETPLAGAAGDAGAEAGAGDVTTTVRCPVPADVTVFPGLAATLTFAGSAAEGALLVPVTAVVGAGESGTVFVPGPDGTPEERDVELGITDGKKVEIRSGLEEGETILEFVPGAAQTDPEGSESEATVEG